jgi:cobalt-zinc-cadmium resistance protein CzcA
VSLLIQFALAQRMFIVLMIVLICAGGYLAYRDLPIDAFPDVSPTQVKVIVKAPGMTPEEVEKRITIPIELELLGLPNQEMLRSVAKYALTDITIDFTDGTDIYWARQQVAERLANVWDDLPGGIDGGIAPMTTPLGEVLMFTIDSDTLSLMERRDILDWIIRPALRTVPGVADVNALGGHARSFEIIPDIASMAARDINLADLQRAIETNNRNDGAGRMDVGEEALLVRTEGRLKTSQDIENIVVAVRGRVPVRLGDIAEVRIGHLTRYGAVSDSAGDEAVEGLVLALRGANARQLVDGVREKLDELEPTLPEGTSVSIFYDRGDLVQRAVSTVSTALLEATVLIMIVLVLFLGTFRSALTVSLSLPLAASITFMMMDQFGMSANLMSLGGLAIAIGMLVDAAVVVVENIVAHLADEKSVNRLPRLHIIYRSVREVSTPVFSGIMIIIIVFLPLLTLQGLEGKLFSPVALTIVFALSGALLMSLTVIPVVASYLLKRVAETEPWLPRKLHEVYAPSLNWALSNNRVVFGVTGGAFVLAIVAYLMIGKTFMPTMDEGDIIVQTEKLPSISLDQSVELDIRVQRAIIENVPEVLRTVARVGSDEIGLDPMSLNETDIFMVLKPRDEWDVSSKDELKDRIREILDRFPGVAYGFTQPIDMRVNEMLSGTRGDIAVKIFGEDLETLTNLAKEVATVLESVPGSEDIFISENEGMQYFQVDIDRLRSGRAGLSNDELADMLRAQIEGLAVGVIQEGIRRTPVIIRGAQDMRESPDQFEQLLIPLGNGANIPLSSIADLRRVEGFVSVDRERGQRFAVVQANVSGRDLVGFVEEARQVVVEQVSMPSGYFTEWGGQFENQQRAAARFAIVIPVALGLIFLMLFSTFGSIKQAILVFMTVPFAMIGGIFGLWISGLYMSVPASVGFIALLGIAVLNGVVMVSYINRLRASGMALLQAVTEGAARRMRPVMMTASIASLALIPLLFASGPGAEIQKPLAIVVIGGLITATLLTLILLPILYLRFEGIAGERT